MYHTIPQLEMLINTLMWKIYCIYYWIIIIILAFKTIYLFHFICYFNLSNNIFKVTADRSSIILNLSRFIIRRIFRND